MDWMLAKKENELRINPNSMPLIKYKWWCSLLRWRQIMEAHLRGCISYYSQKPRSNSWLLPSSASLISNQSSTLITMLAFKNRPLSFMYTSCLLHQEILLGLSSKYIKIWPQYTSSPAIVSQLDYWTTVWTTGLVPLSGYLLLSAPLSPQRLFPT